MSCMVWPLPRWTSSCTGSMPLSATSSTWCPSATLREQVGAEVACALGCPPQSVETGGAQGPGSFKSESPLDGRKRLQYFGPLFGSRFRTQKRVRVRCRIVFACTGLAKGPISGPSFRVCLSPSIAAPFWMRRCCFHTACFVLQGQCFLAASALSIPEVCRPRHSHVEC